MVNKFKELEELIQTSLLHRLDDLPDDLAGRLEKLERRVSDLRGRL
jgi:hypothetical protein